jgi:uncharacterized protein (TIGR00730 family)
MPETEKAYKNIPFLTSSSGRTIRILCEYEEPRSRFVEANVSDTIVIFGSARIRHPGTAQLNIEEAEATLAQAKNSLDAVAISHAERALLQAKRQLKTSRYYEDTRQLAKKLTEWSLSRDRQYLICSGGGPGIMEAANRGASDIPRGRSVGLGISLPFEEKVNSFVPKELAFEFHYFFMRKYWFAYLAKAMVIMPGGFGTMDEFFEILTLRQTKKIKKRLPMVLFGTEYWNSVMNFDAMVEWGVISESDLLLFHKTDSIDDAFHFLTRELEVTEARWGAK